MLCLSSSHCEEPKIISLEPPAVTNLFYVQRHVETESGLILQERIWIQNGNFHELRDRLPSSDSVHSLDQINEENWLKGEAEAETIHNAAGTFGRTRGAYNWKRAEVAVVGKNSTMMATNVPIVLPYRDIIASYSPVFDIDSARRNPDAVWSTGHVSWKSARQTNQAMVAWEVEFNPKTRFKTRERIWRNGELIREQRWQTDTKIDPNQFNMSESDGGKWAEPLPPSVFPLRLETFGGIGVVIPEKFGPFRVESVMYSSPAQNAGIRSGDVIRRVNGMSLDGIPVTPFVMLCRGQVGTLVTLDLDVAGTNAHRRVELRRAELKFR